MSASGFSRGIVFPGTVTHRGLSLNRRCDGSVTDVSRQEKARRRARVHSKRNGADNAVPLSVRPATINYEMRPQSSPPGFSCGQWVWDLLEVFPMKSIARRSLVLFASYVAVAAVAQAHPGHPGHEGGDFTWDFSHLAAHPLVTLGFLTLLTVAVWAGWSHFRSRRSPRV